MSILPLLYIWIVMNNRQMTNPRRNARRWLVLAAGLLALAIGTILVAAGFRSLLAGRALYGLPAWFPFFWSLTLFVPGAVALRRMPLGHAGSRGRDSDVGQRPAMVAGRGQGLAGARRAVSRCVLRSSPRGGTACRTEAAARSSSPYRPPQRPALEVFLAGHAATAEGSLACEDVPDLSEITWIRDEAKR